MKHPTQDQWLDYTYGEAGATGRLDLEAHLAVCPECTRQLGEWRATGGQLDAWTIPHRAPAQSKASAWRWAAAAVLALLLGLAAGRWSVDAKQPREQVAAELRGEFEQRLNGVTAQFSLARQQDQQVTLDLLRAMETRRIAEDASLRESLETVAVLTQSGFQQTEQQMRSLALQTDPVALPAGYRSN